MVNTKLSMNPRQQQQQHPQTGVTIIRMSNTNNKMKNGNHSAGAVATTNGGSGNGNHKQEDEILEVNLIGVNENGTPDNVLGDFTEFLATGQLSDMVMRCADGRFIECHRLMLAARAKNLRHFICGRNYLITELVFRNCVKFEHLQALVNLIYRGHINGQDHQITSTLWKLFKIFGVRVTAKCFKSSQNGQKELAHQLKYDSVENDVEKGALKFEKIIQEYRSETRRKTRRRDTGNVSMASTAEDVHNSSPGGQNKRKNKPARPPGVIVISDDDWSSASCSSSVSSLSSSSSDGEQMETTAAAAAQPPQLVQQPRVIVAKQQHPLVNGKLVLAPKLNATISNSAIKTTATTRSDRDAMSTLRIQDIKSGPDAVMENYESSGSSEGEYVEAYKPPPAKKQKPMTAVTSRQPVLTTTPCLEYNQNEMSIVVKSSQAANNKELTIHRQLPTTPTKPEGASPVKDTESEAIICSPQIMFNIKTEPIDEEDDEDETVDMGIMEEVDMEHLGIKMEIVEDEDYEQTMLSQDRHGRRLPPPLLIPLQTKNRRNLQEMFDDVEEDDEDRMMIGKGKLEQYIANCKPNSRPPANFPPFILRNPRGNQTRTYTTDNLWSALMDVKGGESIYRASQQHKVPRKTLRNWMKRCSIKSAYPMPSQLKEAAEKKKNQPKYC